MACGVAGEGHAEMEGRGAGAHGLERDFRHRTAGAPFWRAGAGMARRPIAF
jgi:hypothetical protein